MKLIFSIILYSVITIISVSCTTDVTDVTLPYNEQLVIQCLLQPDSLITLNITKTLPPLDDYDISKATITNALATITVDNKTYNFVYKGGYYYCNDIVPKSGKSYILEVIWNGKRATARTKVPFPLQIIGFEKNILSSYYDDYYKETYYELAFQAVVSLPKDVTCVGAYQYSFINDNARYYFESYGQSRAYKNTTNQDIIPTNINFSSEYTSDLNYTDTSKIAIVETYDLPFYDYITTVKLHHYDDDNPFGFSGNNPKWNIQGDGIGYFFGMAYSKKHFIF